MKPTPYGLPFPSLFPWSKKTNDDWLDTKQIWVAN